jgi:hypothetical protein
LPDGAVPPPPDAPVKIASAGTATMPTGEAQQTHLIYAENTHRWWLFTITSDAASVVQSWVSPDFATWTQAKDLPLPAPHRGIGANFSVAYASQNGHDVVHLGIGLVSATGHSHFHARAELTNDVAWNTPAVVSTTNSGMETDPEAPAIYISPTGSIIDFPSWADYGNSTQTSGNESAYTSKTPDDGTTWTPGFQAREDVRGVTDQINARQAVGLSGEDVLGLWESGDSEPNPSNVRSARRVNGDWLASLTVFGDSKFDVNDWGAASVVINEVHAVRHAAAWEHSHYTAGDQSWSPGNAIPDLAVKAGAGVVVLHDATRIVVFAIGTDNAVKATTWSSSAWSPWQVVVPAAGAPTALSGWWSKTAGFGLIWTDSGSVIGWRVKVD